MPFTAESTRPTPSGLLAAVLEPDAFDRFSIESMLHDLHWRVVTADTVRDGISILRRNRPAIVFAPAEWLQFLRTEGENPVQTPIVATVRFRDWLRWQDDLNGRVYDILAKPFAQTEVNQVTGSVRFAPAARLLAVSAA